MQKYKMLSVCILFQNVEDKAIPGGTEHKTGKNFIQ